MFYARASALVPFAPHSCSRSSVTQKKNKRLLAVYQVYGSAPGMNGHFFVGLYSTLVRQRFSL